MSQPTSEIVWSTVVSLLVYAWFSDGQAVLSQTYHIAATVDGCVAGPGCRSQRPDAFLAIVEDHLDPIVTGHPGRAWTSPVVMPVVTQARPSSSISMALPSNISAAAPPRRQGPRRSARRSSRT